MRSQNSFMSSTKHFVRIMIHKYPVKPADSAVNYIADFALYTHSKQKLKGRKKNLDIYCFKAAVKPNPKAENGSLKYRLESTDLLVQPVLYVK